MIKNDGRDFSGTHEKFHFIFKNKYNFNPKLGSYRSIKERILENDKINLYIKNSHRRSIKLSFIYFCKYFKLV